MSPEYTYYEYMCLSVKLLYLQSRYICSHVSCMASHGNQKKPTHLRQEAFLEPKWTFDGEPYKGGWCRPQTDGQLVGDSFCCKPPNSFDLFQWKSNSFKKFCLTQKDLSNSSFSKPHLHYLEKVIDTPD